MAAKTINRKVYSQTVGNIFKERYQTESYNIVLRENHDTKFIWYKVYSIFFKERLKFDSNNNYIATGYYCAGKRTLKKTKDPDKRPAGEPKLTLVSREGIDHLVELLNTQPALEEARNYLSARGVFVNKKSNYYAK
ncbi:MAG: hypothetical protein ACP5N3_05820 [Candidatus Nanoarchaeia archaeon]